MSLSLKLEHPSIFGPPPPPWQPHLFQAKPGKQTREPRGPGVAVESDSPSECTGGTGAALIFAAAKRASVLEHERFQQAC